MMDEGLFDPFGLYAFMGSSHAAHWSVLAVILISGVSWALAKPGTGIRKMWAVAFGGAAALGASAVMTMLFGGLLK
jgi:hypothetical protein